jgi:serine/threonine-protein kinase RsbW
MQKPRIVGDTIVIPSNTDFLAEVDSFVEGLLRGYGIDESQIADIAISVSELVNNAIFHGNRASPDKTVTVKVGRFNNSVRIAVSDQGGGFNPDDIANPIAEENLLKEVGRGIFIVESLMDRVDIEVSNGGTTITITKSI